MTPNEAMKLALEVAYMVIKEVVDCPPSTRTWEDDYQPYPQNEIDRETMVIDQLKVILDELTDRIANVEVTE